VRRPSIGGSRTPSSRTQAVRASCRPLAERARCGAGCKYPSAGALSPPAQSGAVGSRGSWSCAESRCRRISTTPRQDFDRRSAVRQHERRLRAGYFADGMVEDILTALSHVRWLFVIAGQSILFGGIAPRDWPLIEGWRCLTWANFTIPHLVSFRSASAVSRRFDGGLR
jgi:hypothetical protein